MRILGWLSLVAIALWVPRPLCAQIDPYPRELIELGYQQEVNGQAPFAGYVYYYRNVPQFVRSNLALRVVVSPTYVDGELGIRGALGPNTDVGIGLAGGGFAYGYHEIRGGIWFQGESWAGHGADVSGSVYHLFNPTARIPLYGVLRSSFQYSIYERNISTAPNFVVPDDQSEINLRGGLRWGGEEFALMRDLGLEVSGWYEGQFRLSPGPYGFAQDRTIEPSVHLFWGRASFRYTMPESKHTLGLGLEAGMAIHPDRLSAYRLGGMLNLASEFLHSIPGYYFGELSAQIFVLLGGFYEVPLDFRKCWRIGAGAATGLVSFTPGMDQPNHWNSGVACGLTYRNPAESVKVALLYGYGINAMRSPGEGGTRLRCLFNSISRNQKPAKAPNPDSHPPNSSDACWAFIDAELF